ncbi:phosphoglycerate dehydrogenase [Bariatricus massiliensis]|uniref:Phosphoglycerate dehydrogenase n=1 Tax=Bariatricus massiliensis TaxID=1745713 RepID=A0ABS8DLE1_9FIRM|nr:phosphoglycerate dehydrogenase [Bariatricus massiliensis]MCB7305719.1 phosphoglycerate dehydrogenase [Bariatricus massiliensis]MCB7376273.1 phosphoglycerate dehydrogenase [Bariatricus massiliensis]MCB7388862.1 phosphoglycerate dehydrogenase [Bariatricus massiliensis]MCB7413035.1 phosphoglycerate dehydrogenase [Bariatricus massiliensis]MCQ5254440.1 phosphoglycerate dehydrogenase [Bariatricus massiliensis]
MKILAALPNYSLYCAEAKRYLQEQGCEVIENETKGPLTFGQLSGLVGDVDGVIAGVDVWDERLMELAPKLKGIARFGVGVDNIDLEAAKKRGIQVCNCPGINTESVAEHALMLILSIMRYFPVLNQAAREGRWPRVMVRELRGKIVGLIGFGAVARNLAEKLQPFGCRITAYDKYPDEMAAKRLGVEMCGLDKVLEESDVLSLHVPALPDTYHLLDEKALEHCRDGVYIVNTSRGTIVDERVVYEGMRAGKIAGYGSDVFETEPVTAKYPLFEFDNYVCTPHTAAESYENYAQTGMATAQALLDVFAGKEPKNKLV